MKYAGMIIIAMHGKGKMHNKEIYHKVLYHARRNRVQLTQHWKATVRNTLQRHSKQSGKFTKPYLFIHHDRNTWELRG